MFGSFGLEKSFGTNSTAGSLKFGTVLPKDSTLRLERVLKSIFASGAKPSTLPCLPYFLPLSTTCVSF